MRPTNRPTPTDKSINKPTNGISKIKLNPFAVTVLTMHRWFDISAADTDLKYKPVIHFRDGWEQTLAWFKANWLPSFAEGKNNRMAGISKRSEDKIDLSAAAIAETKKKNKKNM